MTASQWIKEEIIKRDVSEAHALKIMMLIGALGEEWSMPLETENDKKRVEQSFYESRSVIINYLTGQFFPTRIINAFYT